MASTSTNKQPLLIDRPLHKLLNMSGQKTGNTGYWLANNSCDVLVDCTQNDGALLEDIYVIVRDTTDHTINLFLSSAVDVLRESATESTFFVATISTGTTNEGQIVHLDEMPYQLAPSPVVPLAAANSREAGQFTGFYIPRGYALWAGRAVDGGDANLDFATCPVLGAQGGFY